MRTNLRRQIFMLLAVLSILHGTQIAVASDQASGNPGRSIRPVNSIADSSIHWPSAEQFLRVLTLRDFNTRVVVLGVACLGLACGTIGTFLLLRKRSLTADALSHATLPGIAIAFIIMAKLGGDGKQLAGLLLGAFIFGGLGVGAILVIRHTTRLKDDAALGIVLSVFFGVGLSLLNLIQQMPLGHAAGLNRFIFGKAASMLPVDAWTILIAALVISLSCLVLFKELTLLCFDQGYARSQGWSVITLDMVLMVLVVGVTVIALQSVGLVLAVAMLIIPSAAARFWTEHLARMVIISAVIGMVGGYLGATISALVPRMPTGPVIVLVCSGAFIVSVACGPKRGIVARVVAQKRLGRRVAMQHLLRAVYECSEMAEKKVSSGNTVASVTAPLGELVKVRSWSINQLSRLIRSACRGKLLVSGNSGVALTDHGLREAERVVRNHRLWETYLIHYADIAPSHVDRDADEIEHILGHGMIVHLEQILSEKVKSDPMPPSPHHLSVAPTDVNGVTA